MKDVEFVATLLLLVEEGPKSYSQDDLDEAFAIRDDDWEAKTEVEEQFRAAISYIGSLVDGEEGAQLARSRLKNQTDFYSLLGAVVEMLREGELPDSNDARVALREFIQRVEEERSDSPSSMVREYYEAARSASNDSGPRRKRIEIIGRVMHGDEYEVVEARGGVQ